MLRLTRTLHANGGLAAIGRPDSLTTACPSSTPGASVMVVSTSTTVGFPGDFWLEAWRKKAIVAFHSKNLPEGCRRLAFMMLDADVVAVSPASVWRVLSQAGPLDQWAGKPPHKGTGFEQPPGPHRHCHVRVSRINVSGAAHHLCSILERAKEKYQAARPRVISDNRPQFIARDFRECIRISGLTHVRTSPSCLRSNERSGAGTNR